MACMNAYLLWGMNVYGASQALVNEKCCNLQLVGRVGASDVCMPDHVTAATLDVQLHQAPECAYSSFQESGHVHQARVPLLALGHIKPASVKIILTSAYAQKSLNKHACASLL